MNLSRLKNWWWYHKKIVLLAALVAAALLYMGIQDRQTVKPDYHVGLVSTTPFSPEQLSQMEETFRTAGEDHNGDGQVTVQIHQYPVDLADDSPNAGYNNREILSGLDGDLVGKMSGIFLLDDLETFQQVTGGILSDAAISWEYDLSLAVRKDADPIYHQLFNTFSP